MAPVRLLITDTVALNTGDAAILLGALRALKASFGPDTKFEIADLQPAAARRYYPELTFRPTLHACLVRWAGKGPRLKLAFALAFLAALTWRHAIGRMLRRRLPPALAEAMGRTAACDVVIATGGTYLVPHYDLTPRIVNFLLCLALGRKLVLFTQSLGPFPPGPRRAVLGAILRRCRLILVRDEPSRRHLRALRVPDARIVVTADAAFALAPASIEGETVPTANTPLRVAVSLRDWPHFDKSRAGDGMERYLDGVAALVSDMVGRHGAQVTFLSTCQGIAEYWTDDSRVADAVVARLPAQLRLSVAVDRAHRRPEALIAQFRAFDLVVATRMHAAILALSAGRPVLGIAYEFKTRELLQRVGFGELVVDFEDATGERLINSFDRLLRVRTEIGSGLGRRVAAERHKALAAGTLVRNVVMGAGAAT